MENIVERNNTSFPKQLYEALSQIAHDEKDVLRYHQRLVHDYVLKYPGVRGLLAYHNMGAGKSILGASICESLLEKDVGFKVLFIASKSLHSNMKTNIQKYRSAVHKDETADQIIEHIDSNYNFISLNASNMITQVHRAVKQESVEELEQTFAVPDIADELKKLNIDGNLDNTIVVVDEAHNLFNSITNGSKNAVQLYQNIMTAKRIKVVFLTGSPIVNDPFEIGIGMNMLAGPLDETGQSLFGEDFDDFQGYFVNGDGTGIKNKDKFVNRIVGLVSYFGADSAEQLKLYPEKLPTIVERIPMSSKQYAAYITARDREIEEANRPMRGAVSKKPLQKPEGRSSSYRVRSRQFSNFVYPEYASKTYRDDTGYIRYEKNIELLRPESLRIRNSTGLGDESEFGLEVFSPKIAKLLVNLQAHTKTKFVDEKPDLSRYEKPPGIGPGVIYSQFKDSGVELIARTLQAHGFEEYDSTKLQKGKKLRYATISGEVDIETRQQILDTLVSKENNSGEIIFVLFVTATGAEGLDILNGRWVMVLEPYWHYSRLAQIYARVVRMFGLQDLPVKERYIQPYIYLSDYPSADELKKLSKDDKTKRDALEMIKKQNREPTTDMYLYQESLKNQLTINTFRNALKEASIDCPMHYGKDSDAAPDKRLNCIMCAPTGRKMFINNLGKDINAPSRCEPLVEETIKAKKIIVLVDSVEKEFMYTITDKPHIFEYSNQLNAYREIYEDHPYYDEIYKQLKK